MKRFHLLTAGLLAALSLNAQAEVGIGASLRSEDASLYIPWQAMPQFRVEGEFRMLDDETETLTRSSGAQSSSDITIEGYGLGFYWTPEVDKDWLLLLGVRTSYMRSEFTSRQTATLGGFPPRTVQQVADGELSGYEFAPTLGLEYAFTPKVRLALEASYYYRDLDGKTRARIVDPEVNTAPSVVDQEETTRGTNSRVVLRYFF